MKYTAAISAAKKWTSFPFIFELLIWLLYVCLYKYGYYLNTESIVVSREENFPFISVMGYAVASTLYLIPLYRYIAPYLLDKSRYGLLGMITVLYLAYISKASYLLVSYAFLSINTNPALTQFYQQHFRIALQQSMILLRGWDLQILLMDLLAFGSVVFVQYGYKNQQERLQSEQRQRQLEKDNFALQLSMLKAQLQPHFLFNTLNSLYGLSLTGSRDTPRYILLLSQMMQYILYECDKERQPLEQERTFLENYFELEQLKFPSASIDFKYTSPAGNILIPPLLFLPLVENSFKHGSHRATDHAAIHASLTSEENCIRFRIENDI